MFQPRGIHVQWVEQEAVVLNEETGEVHYLNPQSALIYALVLEYGMPAAVTHARVHIDAPDAQVTEDVQRVIRTLIEKGLLAEVAS